MTGPKSEVQSARDYAEVIARIRQLRIEHPSSLSIGWKAIAYLPHELIMLSATLTDISVVGCKDLTNIVMLSKLPKLRSVNLDSCVSLVNLKPLSYNLDLEVIVLDNCVSLTDLSALHSLPKLRELRLRNCKDLAQSDLSELKKLPSLQTLILPSQPAGSSNTIEPVLQHSIAVSQVRVPHTDDSEDKDASGSDSSPGFHARGAYAGEHAWSRSDYVHVHGALTSLHSRLVSWNELAARHGALRLPFREPELEISRAIRWGKTRLQAQAESVIVARDASVILMRLVKAALILEAWRIDKEATASSEMLLAPQSVKSATSFFVRKIRSLAEDIPYEPAEILDEFRSEHGSSLMQATVTHEWDAFVSHASEDKASLVDVLVHDLRASGLKVWYDSTELSLGDSLRRTIDRGLAQSRFGVIVLSHAFFAKEWPRRELDGLAARENDGIKVLLPVWYNLSEPDVRKYSPMLADRLGISTSMGLPQVVSEILRAVRGRSNSIDA